EADTEPDQGEPSAQHLNLCGEWHQFILSTMTTLALLLGDYNFKSLRVLWRLTHFVAAHQNRST
ncbi:MAG: hypothetical protein ACXQT2_01620, partial [Methanotrichaceae archaeon]